MADKHQRPGSEDSTLADLPPRRVETERIDIVTNGERRLPEFVPPQPGGPPGAPAGPRVVTEDERVYVDEDGTVRRSVDRVEHEPPRRRRTGLAPALLFILALALGAIAIAWYLSRPETKPVPSVEGLALAQAVAQLEDDGFKASIVSEPNNATPGTVYRQNPAAGTNHEDGSTVQLLVSKGPAVVTVPNTVGVDETAARDRLAAVGFTVAVTRVFSDAAEGQVVAQAPRAGISAARGSSVRLQVSKGSRLVGVPTVVGSTATDATARLKAAGLEANVVTVPSTEPAGVVVAQHPTAGEAPRGSAVRLNVSRGS